MFFHVNIAAGKRKEDAIWGDISDKVVIDCGDFSEERLNALLAEVNHKIKRGWRYLQERQFDAESR